MALPTAVSPATLRPGLYLKVNLVAGSSAPGTGTLRVLLMSPKSSAGDLVANSEIRAGGGEATAALAFGPGTPGHLCAKRIYSKFQTAQVDFAAPTAGATNATTTVTFSGTSADATTVELQVEGTTVLVDWLAGEAATLVRDRAVTKINSLAQELPVVASNGGGGGDMVLTGKVPGRISNDIKVKGKILIASGTAAVTPTTYTNLTGGTTDADPATMLGIAAGKEYAFILLVTSNADYHDAAGTSGPEKVITHIKALNSGFEAKLQTAMFASSGSLASAKTAAIARNEGFCQHVLVENGRQLPSVYGARELGGWLLALSLNANPNRIGEVYDGVVGSGDTIADQPTSAEIEDALQNGVSICAYNAADELYIVRPITTYSLDAGGGADRRLLDMSITHATYIVARDMRSFLPQEFPNAKIQKDTEPGEDLPPEGVVEERDVKTTVVARLREWVPRGVILGSSLDEAVSSGALDVKVNATDPGQVDIYAPFKIVPLWVKKSVVFDRLAN